MLRYNAARSIMVRCIFELSLLVPSADGAVINTLNFGKEQSSDGSVISPYVNKRGFRDAVTGAVPTILLLITVPKLGRYK